ncbi:hypothetical protein EYC84_003365 [Monilinia fructicola]|uniref:pyridoxal 5'-phosphate synthase (glutamine hydrolyzing) n=1 Tax=Monilinia fructicola TaxID=38448 RepID=A0A5M9JWE4_MONFR|nr:hypothetical protein EYC84_003365 [Monilinia fructicola]
MLSSSSRKIPTSQHCISEALLFPTYIESIPPTHPSITKPKQKSTTRNAKESDRYRYIQLTLTSSPSHPSFHALNIFSSAKTSARACVPARLQMIHDTNKMSNELPTSATNGHAGNASSTFTVKAGLARMLKGGVIMDVVNAEQARIAEEAGAVAVMALERVPADIRAQGGVARMSDPKMIREIMDTVTIPVMAKARIGHFVECQILQSIGVDYIDESEVLTPADALHHVEKHAFTIPFVCGCRNLGEALRRISEGAAMIRTKGEAGTGDVIEAVRHQRQVTAEIRAASLMSDEELRILAKEIQAPFELLKETAKLGRLPVVNFAAGGIATPADAALMMQLGCDGVFVGSGIFKSGDAAKRARAIVQATTHFNDAKVLAEVSEDLGEAMVGLNCGTMDPKEKMQGRGW